MNFDLNLGKAASVLFLALAMAGCGGGGSQTATTPMEPPAPAPVPPTDLDEAQAAAMAAADAAMTASTNAGTAADGAEAATKNLATIQTGAKAKMYAMDARKYSDMAMTAYMDAKKASDDAAAATDARAATRAEVAAEAAKMKAEDAAGMAADKAMKATEAAMMELMIDGAMTSVGGDSSVDATSGKNTSVVGTGTDAQTTITGLISEPETTGKTTNGREAVPADLTIPRAYTSPMVNAEARTDLKIGKELDTSDDMARLRLITHHAGTKTEPVYASAEGSDLTGTVGSDGRIDTNPAPDVEAFVTLAPVGMFYHAKDGLNGGSTDPAALEPMDPIAGGAQQGDTVAAGAKPMMVYSYTDAGGATIYVVLTSTTVTPADTMVIYSNVDIHHEVNRDGIMGDETVEVTANIPVAAAYDHVNFGVWAGLGDAAKNGEQQIANLGIGFVQSIGDGMTGADMPNNGTATYSGNWAAAVQAADFDGDGAITLESDDASVVANFTAAAITATLTDLATLEGDISGNTFSGTKATATGGGLTVDGTFTGSFSGGFYGAKADEAAGVFDFDSDGNKAGAFRGAFGGQK